MIPCSYMTFDHSYNYIELVKLVRGNMNTIIPFCNLFCHLLYDKHVHVPSCMHTCIHEVGTLLICIS